jgi:LysR family transcriptional regulator, transcription activator of glutamate synthase operon
METEVLRWFQEVADGVTVTEVAETFMVSQPGVSRALARLEDEVGTPLLHKSGRVLRLTHAGAVFKRHVDALVHHLDDGLAAVDQLVDPETGTVTVAFQLSLGTWLVPALISGFRARHPRVEFTLEQSQDARGSSPVAEGRVDLALTARRPGHPDVQWRRLLTEPLLLAVPDGHPVAGRGQVALAEVSGEDFVMLRPTWELRHLSEQLCGAAGFAPRVAFEGDDLPMVTGFVAAGLGVGIVPAMGLDPANPRSDGARLVRLTDAGASRDIGLVWASTRRLLPSAELFREYVVSQHYRQ